MKTIPITNRSRSGYAWDAAKHGSASMRRQIRRVYHDPRGLDSLRDEAPSAYRDIRAVMRAQRD